MSKFILVYHKKLFITELHTIENPASYNSVTVY